MASFTIRNYRGATNLYHSSLRNFEHDNVIYVNLKESLKFYNLFTLGEPARVATDASGGVCILDYAISISRDESYISIVNLTNGQSVSNVGSLEENQLDKLENKFINEDIVNLVECMSERATIKLEAYKYELQKLLSKTSFKTLFISPVDKYSVKIELN